MEDLIQEFWNTNIGPKCAACSTPYQLVQHYSLSYLWLWIMHTNTILYFPHLPFCQFSFSFFLHMNLCFSTYESSCWNVGTSRLSALCKNSSVVFHTITSKNLSHTLRVELHFSTPVGRLNLLASCHLKEDKF